MAAIPTPLRAALGLALTVVDTARETARALPQKAVGLPVAAISNAVQLSLRAQQQYAALTTKGDELIGAFHGAPEEPPTWARFDDEAVADSVPSRNTAFDRVAEADLDDVTDLESVSDLESVADLENLLVAELAVEEMVAEEEVIAEADLMAVGEMVAEADVVTEQIISDGARTTEPREPARKTAKQAAKKAAKKVAEATADAPANKPTAKAPAKAPAKKAPAKKVAAKQVAGKPPLPAPAADEPELSLLPAPRKAAKKAAKKAAGRAPTKAVAQLRASTVEGHPLPDPELS